MAFKWILNGLQVDVDWISSGFLFAGKWMLIGLQVDVDWIASGC